MKSPEEIAAISEFPVLLRTVDNLDLGQYLKEKKLDISSIRYILEHLSLLTYFTQYDLLFPRRNRDSLPVFDIRTLYQPEKNCWFIGIYQIAEAANRVVNEKPDIKESEPPMIIIEEKPGEKKKRILFNSKINNLPISTLYKVTPNKNAWLDEIMTLFSVRIGERWTNIVFKKFFNEYYFGYLKFLEEQTNTTISPQILEIMRSVALDDLSSEEREAIFGKPDINFDEYWGDKINEFTDEKPQLINPPQELTIIDKNRLQITIGEGKPITLPITP